LDFMQNGSYEGCKLEGSVGLGPREVPVEQREFMHPFFPPEGLDSG
jgi:hypothetical protein